MTEKTVPNGEEIARSALEEAEDTDEDTEELASVEDEFRTHLANAEDVADKLKAIERRWLKEGREVQPQDIATVFGILHGDVMSSIKELINSCGGAFQELFDNLSDSGDDEDDDEELSEETINVYAALLANEEAFRNLASAAGLDSVQKNGFEQMVKINQDALKVFDEQYGAEISQKAREQVERARTSQVS